MVCLHVNTRIRKNTIIVNIHFYINTNTDIFWLINAAYNINAHKLDSLFQRRKLVVSNVL